MKISNQDYEKWTWNQYIEQSINQSKFSISTYSHLSSQNYLYRNTIMEVNYYLTEIFDGIAQFKIV